MGALKINSKIVISLFWLFVFVFAAVGTSLYIDRVLSQKGVVKGILYAMEESSAIVDNQVVKIGDTIYGVKIVNIEKTAVEFEKNGNRWKQRLREKPDPAWENP